MVRITAAVSRHEERARRTLAIGVLSLLAACFWTPASAGSFTAFESGQVRPMALSPNGNRLFVANTPDNRLEIFRVTGAGLIHTGSVPVGMEPVAVAARTNSEVWVVNHLSDSVSIVDTASAQARVVRTLLMGDEPRDIVFAGPDGNRAFISAANRNLPRPAGTNERNADIWVFDALALGQGGGVPIAVVNLFSDVPRALAVSPDGNTVYAAAHFSGNQTTIVGGNKVDGNLPPPLENHEGAPAPSTGLIVKWDGAEWRDGAGGIWSDDVKFSLPDWDVFAIDAAAAVPAEIDRHAHVGTTLFNMVANPQSGNIYVSNTEARNNVRFEGPGVYFDSTVRGHIVESRITVIDGQGNVTPRHLNKHVDRESFPGTPEENAASLAFPLEMVVTADGSTLYVAALGSSKIGIFDTQDLEDDSFVPNEADHIEVAGGGPTGLILDEARDRMYVLKRFTNTVGIIDLSTQAEISEAPLFNPEPASIVDGRPFLYDARLTSSAGDNACASCHIFGDTDHLGWDLGNPDGDVTPNPNPFKLLVDGISTDFHPMKGPMTTQSFRGMDNNGPMHWRGDRTGGNDPESGDPLDEDAAFRAFNVAFEGLVGRTGPLTDPEMQAFTDFTLQLTYPPNPVRPIDNQLTPEQARGRDDYLNLPVESFGFSCHTCHVLQPNARFFGTDGQSSGRERMSQAEILKVPHIRNLYTKVGIPESIGAATGDQIRGFHFGHEGGTEKILVFLNSAQFDFPGGNDQRMDMVNFLMAFDTELAPVVGQQVTMTNTNRLLARQRVTIFMERAAISGPELPECDLIVKGVADGEQRGWFRLNNGAFRSDRASEPLRGRNFLEQLSQTPGQEMTFTCTPPGSGVRMGIDRDEDGIFDRDELDAGSDPLDASSKPLVARAGR